MKIFKHWFIVKRPYVAVLRKAREYIKKYPPDNNLNDERTLSQRRFGFEDGYIACLNDLGINQTIENIKNKNNNCA